jgi:hypothetical protein
MYCNELVEEGILFVNPMGMFWAHKECHHSIDMAIMDEPIICTTECDVNKGLEHWGFK